MLVAPLARSLASVAAISASMSSKCSPPGPKEATACAASLARREQPIDAGRARVLADLPMEGDALVADLTHIAEHQPARAADAREHGDGGAHRIRVRIVGVVNDRGALGSRLGLEPAGKRPEGGQRTLRRLQTGAGRPSRRRSPRGRWRRCVVPGACNWKLVAPSGVSTSTTLPQGSARQRADTAAGASKPKSRTVIPAPSALRRATTPFQNGA